MKNWLAQAADNYGQVVALWGGSEPLSYAELHKKAMTCAGGLSAAGIKAGDRVGLLLDSGPMMVTIIHGLLGIGAVIVPLNSRLSATERAAQIAQSGCTVLLYGDAWNAPSELPPQVRLIRSAHLFQSPPRSLEDFAPDAPAALVFTSGSSGQPKAATLTYANFWHSVQASAQRLGVQPDDRWLCPLPLYHVGGLSILFRSAIYGTSIVLPYTQDGIATAFRYQPTLVSLVPTQLYRLIREKVEFPASLRLILLGGAAASSELLTLCQEMGLPIAATYGLTEACSQVATATPNQVYAKHGTVGKPLEGVQIRIIGPDGEGLNAGEVGEIVVSGPTVMAGYDNNPQATAHALRDGELHTGDLGYLDADGDLFVLQRRDDLILSGGENVMPAEVENVLLRHPNVAEACVVGLPDDEWGQIVGAAIVLKAGDTTADELREFCRDHLGGYKIPRRFIFVASLPQTASGKVLRREVLALFD